MIRSVFSVLVLVFALANTQECSNTCNYRKSIVCASNGVTFRNQCIMQKWACINGVSLTVSAYGRCKQPDNLNKQHLQGGGSSSSSEEDSGSSEEKHTPTRPLSPTNPPIVTAIVTTGLPGPMATTTLRPAALETKPATEDTFTDSAEMFPTDVINTEESGTNEPPVVTPCNMNCPLVLDIVCGTDGVTYQSRCVLEAEACMARETRGDTTITVAYPGPCVTPIPATDSPPVLPDVTPNLS